MGPTRHGLRMGFMQASFYCPGRAQEIRTGPPMAPLSIGFTHLTLLGGAAHAYAVYLGWVNVEFLRSNCMDSGVGIQLPCAITMVLPKGISMKVPYGRARDHNVHHLHHHQHHLGRGPFWVLPIWRSIDSMGLIATDMRFFLRHRL